MGLPMSMLKCNPDGSDPKILANASNITHFGYFQRLSVREFIVFVGRTVGKRTPPGQRQSFRFGFGVRSNTKYIRTSEMAFVQWASWMITTQSGVHFLFLTR
ncbi:hypothetical protein CsSME_00025381 [Camellia sinensis var. sinensis]